MVAALAIIASPALSQASLRREGWSFVASSVAIAGAVAWVFASMAPAVQKSSINPAYSLTIDQASSTPSTLTVMTIVTVCLLPIVLVYVFWSYWMFRRGRRDADGSAAQEDPRGRELLRQLILASRRARPPRRGRARLLSRHEDEDL